MVTTQTRRTFERSSSENFAIYDQDGNIRSDFMALVLDAVEGKDQHLVQSRVASLHETELGHLLESIEPAQRSPLIELLGDQFDMTALTHIDDAIRREIIEVMPNRQIAAGIGRLESDDAVYILEDLRREDRDDILSQLPFTERVRLRRSLEYPESSAGRRMQTEFVAVPPFWTVGQTIDYIQEDDRLPDSFTQVFVVDPTFKLLGSVDLDQILRAKRPLKIQEIMRDTAHPIPAQMDQEEAAHLFEQYDLLSAAVLDENGRLVGVLTIDDVVDVINEEADEDIKRLGGVGNEELSDNIFSTVRSRILWLLVNLGTALISANVIRLFDQSIEKMIALAVLMPIVASMGGNAGTQTMTVTVRALATGDLDIYNAARIIRREAGVGIINGGLLAVVMGAIASVWFGDPQLGYLIGAAMIINLFAAALAGILLPLSLDKLGADPAIASSVFVTTVTDCVGFFAFLGLATWWFNL
ncbi:magnesium transporter [Oryzifoliimicrobium ureilyticus]|uniref:magnesium transporter n=1 Tax=Oryzifoliimicrobium ureilyticus TaxID=3113724 RepID=UPI003F681FDC